MNAGTCRAHLTFINNNRAAVSDRFSLLMCLSDAAVARAIALNAGIEVLEWSEKLPIEGVAKSVCGCA